MSLLNQQQLAALSDGEKRRRLVELSAEALMLAASLEGTPPEAANGAGQDTVRWLTTREACDHLRVCRQTLIDHRKAGRLHPRKLGRQKEYLASELDALDVGQGGPGK